MRDMLESKLKRFEELERMMLDPEIQTVSTKIAAVAREHGSIARMANKYRRFKKLNTQLTELKVMADSHDPEEREMAEAEIETLREEREEIWDELLVLTLGGDDAHRARCQLEIRAGTGGDEAALFARNLYDMYKRHAENRGWKIELIDANPTELGGFKEIILAIEGEGAFRELQYESGGHRVQRVPETEAKGRVHTSAATVAVMAEPEDVEVNLTPDDYRLDKFNASGPGGQHVNKTESAVRLTHHETGIVVQCQDEKSQHKNLAKALRVLKTRIYERKVLEEQEKRSSERKTLIGSGDRSQRIRTYNFPENRVSDHRINLTIYKLDQILAGDMQVLTDSLIDHDRQSLREAMGGLE
ncbi:peptide chain release factor 1 [Lignipirellula cremea]|uniref:Peptide chain release factor 1 n=1 Tax=Lignipirellula cremea TaxID=2528010 RepID=A0A518DUK2_9BACT|nr:peptide chain release factor 1 [Lignipirellula cremea]QDU95517.1 Peptide chain release factor RF1 [Lignipirellula cremea]